MIWQTPPAPIPSPDCPPASPAPPPAKRAAGVECVIHYKNGPAPENYRDGVDFVAQKFGLK